MNTEIFKQVGNNISAILATKEQTQQSLADRLNISKQVMSKIISGSKAINVAEITKIAQILEVPVDELLKISDEQDAPYDFSFFDDIKNEETREKMDVLRTIIDEILMLEEYLSELHNIE